MKTHLCWSFGGGVQSAAIAVLVREGVLPVPDLAVIADTARERRTTWDYMHDVILPYLEPIGVKIQIASHDLARVGLFDKNHKPLMPLYSLPSGRMPAYCSGEWKRDVVERWLRLQGVKDCVQWLGFSTDEARRATGKAHRPWCRPAYPLIEKGVSRDMCYLLVERAGLPKPPKSRCYDCPHQNRDEWHDVLTDSVDGPKAIATDNLIREADETHSLFLHSSRIPLDQVDFSQPAHVESDDFPLFRECQDAGCYT